MIIPHAKIGSSRRHPVLCLERPLSDTLPIVSHQKGQSPPPLATRSLPVPMVTDHDEDAIEALEPTDGESGSEDCVSENHRRSNRQHSQSLRRPISQGYRRNFSSSMFVVNFPTFV